MVILVESLSIGLKKSLHSLPVEVEILSSLITFRGSSFHLQSRFADAREAPLAPCQDNVEQQHSHGCGQNSHQSRSHIASFATDGG